MWITLWNETITSKCTIVLNHNTSPCHKFRFMRLHWAPGTDNVCVTGCFISIVQTGWSPPPICGQTTRQAAGNTSWNMMPGSFRPPLCYWIQNMFVSAPVHYLLTEACSGLALEHTPTGKISLTKVFSVPDGQSKVYEDKSKTCAEYEMPSTSTKEENNKYT